MTSPSTGFAARSKLLLNSIAPVMEGGSAFSATAMVWHSPQPVHGENEAEVRKWKGAPQQKSNHGMSREGSRERHAGKKAREGAFAFICLP